MNSDSPLKMVSPLPRRGNWRKFGSPRLRDQRLAEVLEFLGSIPDYESYVLKWFKQFEVVDRRLMSTIMEKMVTMDRTDPEYCKGLDKELGLFLAGAATQSLLTSIDGPVDLDRSTWSDNVLDLEFDFRDARSNIFEGDAERVPIRIGNVDVTLITAQMPYLVEYPAAGIDDQTKQKMAHFLGPICLQPFHLVTKLQGKNLASLMRRMLRTPRWSRSNAEFVAKEMEKFAS